MTSDSTQYEFNIIVNGVNRRYSIGPVYAEDGRLRQVSLRHAAEGAEEGQVIDLDLDPALFTQFALPNLMTMFKIAISQAGSEGLFGNTSHRSGITLDFALEAWEGDLTPI